MCCESAACREAPLQRMKRRRRRRCAHFEGWAGGVSLVDNVKGGSCRPTQQPQPHVRHVAFAWIALEQVKTSSPT